LSVNANHCRKWIHPRALFYDDPAVYFNSTRGDELLAGTPAAEPGLRQHLLQSHTFVNNAH
jgi:hypothetical protein